MFQFILGINRIHKNCNSPRFPYAELSDNAHWQVIATGPGREKVWKLHRRCVELGGDVRTGLEDTLYLPNAERATNNGQLVETLVKIVHEVGKEVASTSEAREILNVLK